jgi:spore coat protein H
MVFDYTYIENRLSHILLSKIDLWPLHSFYTEVVFNRKHHQGLYLFVEDPEEYAIYQKDAEVIMRRYYENVISDIELHSSIDQNLENDYIKDFTQIYTIITQYQGEQLYNKLAHKLNITNYMRKMALDYIIKNGDYTDEIYFYGSTKNDTIYYEIIPWDYDDIFAEQAHEIGRAIFVGKKFGERQYNNKEELEEAINGRLVFSIEDDIDYIITNDDYLYSKYLNELQYVLSVIDEHTIKSAFSQVKSELDEFYKNDEIIAQSVYDEQETNNSLYESNFEQKQSYLINRVNNIAIKLNQQISEFKNEY